MRLRTLLLIPVAAALGLLASCGDETIKSDPSTTTAGSGAPTTTIAGALPKPEVKIPAAIPTELVITDVTEGAGTAAANGDTLVVHYVGVRSADGTEFDNNFDTGTPFSVTLGASQVIRGWDQGLIGIKQGGRRQLDIPPDLAYADTPPQGDVIKAGDALSFVIDVEAVIPKSDPADAPTVSIAATPNQSELTFTDLVVGDGAEIKAGQTVAIHLVAFSAADGAQLDSSWESGTPLTFAPGREQTLPGLERAVEGMKVGGRRQVTIPFNDAWGPDGNASLGLPASTDLIMIIDLIAVY